MKIITNYQPRDIVYGFELTPKEREDFDYLEPENLDNNSFVRYRGELYDLGDFMAWDNPASPTKAWDGFRSDSYFSGIVIKYTDDYERVICGLALS